MCGLFATHSCAERGHIKRLLGAISQETFLWRLIGVSRIGGSEALIVALGENRLPPAVWPWRISGHCVQPTLQLVWW